MLRTTPISVALVGLALAACSSEALKPTDGATDVGAPAAGGGSATRRSPYPEGPYGRGVGATIANLSFLGWRDPQAAAYDPSRLEKVELSDFYNPDGKSDVRLLLLNASAVWCSVCRSEYRHIRTADVYSTYRPQGLEMLGVLFEDVNYNPAKPSDLVVWGGPDGYQLPFGLVLDPGFKTGVYFESDATPMNMLIDTKSMTIVSVMMGYNSTSPDEYWEQIGDWLKR